MGNKVRIRYFDIAKGITILCVIAGHFGVKSINQVVFSFHMPLFFIISGYFLKTDNDLKGFVSRKAKQLLFPYVLTVCSVSVGAVLYRLCDTHNADGILELALNWIKAGIYGAGSTGSGLPESIWSIGAIWFLLALFFATIEVRFFAEKKYGFLFILTLAYIAAVSRRYVWLPFSIQMGALCAVFVYMGYLAKKFHIFERKIPDWGKILGLIVWGGYIGYCAVFSAVQGTLSNGLLDFIVPFIGAYFVLELSKAIEYRTHYLSDILEFYGKNTLIILCAHLFELNVFPWDKIWPFLAEDCHLGFNAQVWVLFIFKVIWSTLAVLVVNKLPIVKEIFQGKGIPALAKTIKVQSIDRKEWENVILGFSIILIPLGMDMLKDQEGSLAFSVAIGMLFILLGMKIGRGNKRDLGKVIKKLLLGYFGFTLLTILIDVIISGNNSFEILNSILAIAGGMSASSGHFSWIGTIQLLWVLPCMISCIVIWLLINYATKNNIEVKVALSFVCSVAGILIGTHYAFLPWSVDVAMVMIMFVAFGAVFLLHELKKKIEGYIVIVSGIIVLDLLIFGISFDIVYRNYSCPPFGMLLGLSASVCVVFIAKYICQINWFQIIAKKAGEYAWLIGGMYYLEIVFFDWRSKIELHLPIEITPLRAWLIRVCVFFVLIFFCEFIKSKIQYRRMKNA